MNQNVFRTIEWREVKLVAMALRPCYASDELVNYCQIQQLSHLFLVILFARFLLYKDLHRYNKSNVLEIHIQNKVLMWMHWCESVDIYTLVLYILSIMCYLY